MKATDGSADLRDDGRLECKACDNGDETTFVAKPWRFSRLQGPVARAIPANDAATLYLKVVTYYRCL